MIAGRLRDRGWFPKSLDAWGRMPPKAGCDDREQAEGEIVRLMRVATE